MNLGELIDWLERQNPEQVVECGFGRPHSYRLDYSELAFRPEANVTIASMLENARSAVGSTYQGWKGGEFRMELCTPVHVAHYGDPEEATIESLTYGVEIAALQRQLARLWAYTPDNAEECPACEDVGDVCPWHRGFSSGLFLAGKVLEGLIENDFQSLDQKRTAAAFAELAANGGL